MKKPVLIAAAIAVIAVIGIYFLPVTPGATAHGPNDGHNHGSDSAQIQTADIIKAAKANLPADKQALLQKLEQDVVRGDVANQKIANNLQLSRFWKEEGDNYLLYAFYFGEASKLENSDKNLTFAAQLFLDRIRGISEPPVKVWMATQAKALLEASLKINPNNDSAQVALGSTYLFGAATGGNPQEMMQGILKIRDVATKDSNNAYAQLMLGLASMQTNQLDKAIERLEKVARLAPDNVEGLLTLAEAYERKGEKAKAAKYYRQTKSIVESPQLKQALEERIKELE